MNLNFDYYNHLEEVELYLCNPNEDQKYVIPAFNKSLTLRLNDLSELSFDVKDKITTQDGSTSKLEAYDMVETKRLIYATGIGWFIITNITENDVYTNKQKTVTCESYQAVFKDRGVITEETVYYLFNPNDPYDTTYVSGAENNVPSVVGQLYRQLGIQLDLSGNERITPYDDWTITYIPQEFYGEKGRNFKKENNTGYDFMVNQVEKAFNVVVLFDFLNKSIQIKKANEVTEMSSVLFSFNNFMKDINVTENAKEIVTVLNCNGSEIDITLVNPMGTNYICDFSYYMDPNGKWMSSGLITKLNAWKTYYDTQKPIYEGYVTNYKEAALQQRDLEDDIQEISLMLTDLQNTQSRRAMLYSDMAEYAVGNVDLCERPLISKENLAIAGYTVTGTGLEPLCPQGGFFRYRTTTIDTYVYIHYTPILFVNGVPSIFTPLLATTYLNNKLNDNTVDTKPLERDPNKIMLKSVNLPSTISAADVEAYLNYGTSTVAIESFLAEEDAWADKLEDLQVGYYLTTPKSVDGIIFTEEVLVGNRSYEQGSAYYSTNFTGDTVITAYHDQPDWNAATQQFVPKAGGRQITGTADDICGLLAQDELYQYNYFFDGGHGYCMLKGKAEVSGDINNPLVSDVTYSCAGYDKYTVLDDVNKWIGIYTGVSKTKNDSLDAIKSSMDIIAGHLKDITEATNIISYFSDTPSLLKELSCYWSEGDYTNDNISKLENQTLAEQMDLAKELMEAGATELSKVCQPKFSFTIDVLNVLKNPEFKDQMSDLVLGKIITIEKEEGLWYYPALVEMTFKLDGDGDVSVQFANCLRLDDWGYTYSDLITEASSTAKQVNGSWQGITAYMNDKPRIDSLIASPLDSTLHAAYANMKNQEFVINDVGILGRKFTSDSKNAYEKEQVRMTNNVLLFTDDNWETVKTALGKIYFTDPDTGDVSSSYGLIAETIVGDLIIGRTLNIRNEDSKVVIDVEGISIYSDLNMPVFRATTDGELMLRSNSDAQSEIGETNIQGGILTQLSSYRREKTTLEYGILKQEYNYPNYTTSTYRKILIDPKSNVANVADGILFYRREFPGQVVPDLEWLSYGITCQSYRSTLDPLDPDYLPEQSIRMCDRLGYLVGTWKSQSSIAVDSDANKKHSIEVLDAGYDKLFDKLQPKRYKYNDGSSDRYHVGFIAQEVEKAITDAGLDTQDFAAYMRFGDEGRQYTTYGLRYEEFIALNTRQIQELKKIVKEQKKQINELTKQIEELKHGN